jgi:hypothetical protein
VSQALLVAGLPGPSMWRAFFQMSTQSTKRLSVIAARAEEVSGLFLAMGLAGS